MANPEHVEIVRAGKKAIDRFMRSFPDISLDLKGAKLSGIDLSATNLAGAQLFEADLTMSSLNAANLQSANFNGANLRQASLKRANLSSAVLNQTDLAKANFSQAILTGATFVGAFFWDTEVTHADFSGALFAFCHFSATDLSSAKGLDMIVHAAPNTIGVDSLYRSNGKIPKAFLQGSGLPDEFIELIPSITGNPRDFYSCFISYSHADKQFARQLHDRLQGKGIRCWLDEHAMKPGDDIYAAVDKGIRLWDKLLLCCSESSLDSWWVERELDTAIEKEMEFRKSKGENVYKIIPLNLDGSLFKWEGSHAATLRKRLAADFTDWKSDADKFDQQFEKVVKALRSDDGPPPPTPKLGA